MAWLVTDAAFSGHIEERDTAGGGERIEKKWEIESGFEANSTLPTQERNEGKWS